MKILLLDIETAPNLVYVYQYWNQNVTIDKVENPDYMLCWAAKWYGKIKYIQVIVNTKVRRR